MDPLSLVRDFNVNKKVDKIRIEGEDVNFDGQYVFPKKSFTAFRGARDYCTLEVVLWVLKTRAAQQPDYLKQAAAAKLDTLSFIERKKLLDILDGKANLQLEAGPGMPASADKSAEGEGSEPAAKRAKLDGPGALEEQRFTRQLRDRNTTLLAPNKEFELVLDTANRAHLQLSNLFKQQQQQQQQAAAQAKAQAADANKPRAEKPAQPTTKPSAPAGAPKPSGRFDRDTTQDALKAFGGEAAVGINQVIDMYGSARGAAAAAPPAAANQPANGGALPPPPPRPGPPAAASQGPPSASKSKEAQQQQQRQGSHKQASSSAQPPVKSMALGGMRPAPAAAPADPLQGAVPIIIVPSGMTAMINMYNARQFLEEGRFEASGPLAAANVKKESEITIHRTAGKPHGKRVPYIVTEKAPAQKDQAKWGRVVAVIASGQKWQFKEWPYKGASSGDMFETFSKVCGFYVHFADDKVADTVTTWNVKRLGLARERRHMDAPILLDFFNHLDSFLSARKSPLAY